LGGWVGDFTHQLGDFTQHFGRHYRKARALERKIAKTGGTYRLSPTFGSP
jgi:hypothetical protein